MGVLEMKDVNKNNKEIFEFFKQLNLQDVQKLIIEPGETISSYYSQFRFKIKDGTKVIFYYKHNEQVSSIGVRKSNNDFLHFFRKEDEYWIENIWNQFVDCFNLRIRLMFINENMPWRWELEYVK